MNESNTINCPNCGFSINVNDVLYHKMEEKIQFEYQKKINQNEQEYKVKLHEINEKEAQLKQEKENNDKRIEEIVNSKLKIETNILTEQIKDKAYKDNEEVINKLQKELNDLSPIVQENNLIKAENEKIKRQNDEMRSKYELEKEKEITEVKIQEQERLAKQFEEKYHLKLQEKDKKIADITKLAEETKRKAEQGSMQLQGEIQELELEKLLKEKFVFDIIEEVKKGQRGADAIQYVRTEMGVDCGKIYYESKRTKNFDANWLTKLKNDNLNVKADILVLVTETMPNNEKTFIYRDNVWICSFWNVGILTQVLRYGLIQLQKERSINQNKGSKTELLYNYLTSNEFAGQFNAIIEGYTSLKKSYEDERRKMLQIWKEREKQFEKILDNANYLYGNLKGIAGGNVIYVQQLEDPKENNILKLTD